MKVLDKLRGTKSTVGLDIGTNSIKLVKIIHHKGKHFLDSVAIREMPKSTVEGSAIKKPESFVAALKETVGQIPDENVIISMSGAGIISDKVTFNIDPQDYEDEFIRFEASQRSPFDVEGITLDYKILKRSEADNQIEVLIVASKNDLISEYVDLLYDAGLRPIIVDVDAFAVYNCYGMEKFGISESGTVSLINVGHDLTNVSFVEDGLFHSLRDVNTAGSFFLSTIQRNMGISFEETKKLLRGTSQKAVEQDALRDSIEYAAEELASGIDLAFSYYRNSENSKPIEQVFMCGGGTYIPGLLTFLEKRLNLPITVSDPLAHITYDPAIFEGQNPQQFSALLSVAVGLALRETEYD